ncbi:MAG TPA: PQQ-binding-like beta-propeller repeat protein, partial [Candidatus Saccharimonadales bacterium]|nr:PQQ-binding-like beta-propeller repeat protein [Candidatus Saccharimonadales bacterium]
LLVLHHRLGENEVVECLDPATGVSKWKYAYGSGYIDPYGYNNGPRASPILTSNRCYTFGAEGKLVCLELATGKLIWQRDTAKDWSVPAPFFGVGSTPLLEEGKLFVMVGGQPNSGMVAFDPATGKTLWENIGKTNWDGAITIGWRAERPYEWQGEEKQASYSSPVLATIHGKKHLLCLMRQGLVSLDPSNGRVNFSRWFQSFEDNSVNAMCPVVQDDLILISGAYYRVGAVLLKVKPDGKSFDEIWRIPRSPFERDRETGRFLPPVLELHWNTPILHEGYLYAFSGRNEPDATFRSVEFKTGKLMWSRDERWAGHPPHGSNAQPNVFGRGSAILAQGNLYAVGEAGLLGIFKANPARLEEICRWQVPQLHYPCWAAPILARKKLYLRSEDHLVCINLANNPSANKE